MQRKLKTVIKVFEILCSEKSLPISSQTHSIHSCVSPCHVDLFFLLVFLFRFKLKYHPEDSVKRHDEQKEALQKRVESFESFWKLKKFEGVSVDGDKSDPILKLLDSVVILLEGGSDNDLKVMA